MVKKSGVGRTKVRNDQEFMVKVRFTSKNDFLGDPFAVSKLIKEELDKVELVRVTRSGMMLISCVKAQKEKALLLYKMLTYDVGSYDCQSRAPVKGVNSGVSLDKESV